ncbi:MAG: hypothetical protein KJ821_00415 [Actinobacteria bacterium]|nr:hypothetical protein [Actinomycetota bacterium]
MSKSILKKGFLVLVIIALSGTLLTGCTLFDRTVTVGISGDATALSKAYFIFVDDDEPVGTITGSQTIEITGLSIGKHTFKATTELGDYLGEATDYVLLWPTTVTIPVAVALE